MPWVRLDDQFPIHRKVGALSDPAFRLHVEALCWCARHLTDGVVSRDDLSTVSRIRGAERYAAELVRRGCWSETDEGWVIHDYLEYQQSRSKVLQTREQRQKAGRAGGKRSGESRRSSKTAGQDANGSKDEANAKHVASHPVEPPAPFLLTKEGTGRPPASRGGADDPADPNPDYRGLPAFGAPRDPADAERARRGAAQVRANIHPPKRINGSAGAFAKLVAVTGPPRPSPHPFDDDGTGSCLRCSQPYAAEAHAVGELS
jgi:hypothetical protein